MHTLPDVRTLPLPSKFLVALQKLILRTLEISGSKMGNQLVEAIFGKTITFGQLQIPSMQDCVEAIRGEGMTRPNIRIRELVDLFGAINPTTPVCDECGEFAINQIGGKFMELQPDELCPFCLQGHVKIEPMILRTVNWATGELVVPNIDYDSHSRIGLGIPLTDEAIVKWADGINMDLDAALVAAKISIHGFLAYLYLRQHAFAQLEDVPKFLLSPRGFDTKYSEETLDRLIREASQFLDVREITNLPHKKFLPDGRRRDEFTSITIGGRAYLIDGKIGEGDKCDVYAGRWDHEPTERVVVKIARVGVSDDRLRAERTNLELLAKSDAQGVEFFRQLLPEIISFGSVQDPNGQSRSCVVYRDRNGFDWTLADVMRAYPQGVEPQTMVWMFNRTLMLLAWMHEHDIVHGALTPGHMLIHPKYHGLMFLDLAYAGRIGQPLPDVEPSHVLYRPSASLTNNVFHPMMDICMAARCMIVVMGGNLEQKTIPTTVPDPLAALLSNLAFPDDRHLWGSRYAKLADQVKASFGAIAETVYGPRKYHAFEMPPVA